MILNRHQRVMTMRTETNYTESLICDEALQQAVETDYRIQIIRSGLTRDGNRYYPHETLRAAVDSGLYDEAQMYLNHQLNPIEMHRNVRDFAGIIMPGSVTFDETTGTVYGVARMISEDAINILSSELARKSLGISQSVSGIAERGRIDGNECVIINSITDVYSVDIVPTGNAWGWFTENFESKPDIVENAVEQTIETIETEEGEMMDLEKLTLEVLTESRPDIVEAIKAETEQMIEERIAEMKAIEEAAKHVAEMISASDLPEFSKAKLVEVCAGKTSEEVEHMIEAEKTYVAAIVETVPVQMIAPSEPVVEADTNSKVEYETKFKNFLKQNGFESSKIEQITEVK